MGLLSGIVTLPLAPVRGVVWMIDHLKQHAEAQYYDTALIQRQLAAVDEAHEAGELTDQQRDELQAEWLDRLFEAQRRRQSGEM
ncbi:Gas vesicle protein G [Saccharopolyspora kobensis]|uniref:Gas vesicle protein G n=1 Tax=Saccharopolyspora kobensis TaxID=146035 RepID=A0A1H6ACI7_9PSEU|nr:gas vesicle protein GvpG [Saccharopolyspora kobensis]SEG46428.1 Gas vesicle protein G [Saccharopolyspora kobensis]SFE54570.1 Gas vesicle protein G [Saccharopolyspora kobensis]